MKCGRCCIESEDMTGWESLGDGWGYCPECLACGRCEKCAWERQQMMNASKRGTYNLPRRSQLEHLTEEERAIYDLVQRIERLGAHILLTDVVVKLGEARERLADWVDMQKMVEVAA